MLRNSGGGVWWWMTRGLAISALFITAPPIFRLGKSQALVVSFALALFYFAKGMITLLRSSSSCNHKPIAQPSRLQPEWTRLLNILEIPLFFFMIYGAFVFLPMWIAKPYEWFLICSSPVFTLLEGVCASLFIYFVGKYFMGGIKEFSTLVKCIVLLLFLAVLVCCSLVIVNIYLSLSLSVASATLIGSTISLALVLLIVSLVKEEGTVLDALLLVVYTTYLIWLNTKNNFKPSRHSGGIYAKLYDLNLTSILGYILPDLNIVNSFVAFVRLLSPLVMFNLFLRIGLFVCAAKIMELVNWQGEEESSSFGDEISYNDLLVAFGKSILIMIYTYSWLQESDSSIGNSHYIWRWINIYLTLGLYARNLYLGIDFE